MKEYTYIFMFVASLWAMCSCSKDDNDDLKKVFDDSITEVIVYDDGKTSTGVEFILDYDSDTYISCYINEIHYELYKLDNSCSIQQSDITLRGSVCPYCYVVYKGERYWSKSINWYAFRGQTEITSFKVPETVRELGKSVFSSCLNLQTITLSDSLRNIENGVFYSCRALQSIVFPDSLQTISDCAFQGCASIKSLVFPNNLQYIGSFAFEGCSSVESIVIPANITFIGWWAFRACDNLKDVYTASRFEPKDVMSLPFNDNERGATLHVPAGTKEWYQKSFAWRRFGNIVEDYNP